MFVKLEFRLFNKKKMQFKLEAENDATSKALYLKKSNK